jgi:hypothetical protein
MMRLRPLLLLACLTLLHAHIGVKDVYFEGLAGPYPLYVVIQPPAVIPGVAEVQVRVSAKDVDKIEITPMTITGPGSQYPPTPDVMVRSADDPQLFVGSSWLMVSGAWQVRLTAHGARGSGVLAVPVAAASERVAQMDPAIGVVLSVLLALLVLGAVGIAGAAFAQARRKPGDPPLSGRSLWVVRGISLLVTLLIVAGGWQWWAAEAADYADSIYKPLAMEATQNGSQLDIRLRHTGWYQDPKLDGFIEDHGYRMHLFLIEKSGFNHFYHLHPISESPGLFSFRLPKIAAGNYAVFADVVHRNGFAETLTSAVELQPVSLPAEPSSADDTFAQFAEVYNKLKPAQLANGWQVRWEAPGELRAQRPVQLRFTITDKDGNPVKSIQPYLGMPGHLVVFRKDLTVFAHLHPSGTASMAAHQLAQRTASGELPVANSGTAAVPGHTMNLDEPGLLNFPFGFPGSGEYRMVLQFRDFKEIFTVPFDFSVQD